MLSASPAGSSVFALRASAAFLDAIGQHDSPALLLLLGMGLLKPPAQVAARTGWTAGMQHVTHASSSEPSSI